MDLKAQRQKLRLSQSALARLSGVSRIRICLHELGDRPLDSNDLKRIEQALRKEAARMRIALDSIQSADLGSPVPELK
jgi:predicted transcriptional regulator